MENSINPFGKFVGLATPVALISAILYQYLYWYSFGIVIFDFLPFSALIVYSIVPVFAALAILMLLFVLVSVIKSSGLLGRGLWVLVFIGIAFGVQAWFIGIHVLWVFLPLVGTPVAAVALDRIKSYKSVVPDSTSRFALTFSICLVLLSSAAVGKMQAGGVVSRTDYYTIEMLDEASKGLSSRGAHWIYLGKADNLLFLLSESDNAIVVSKIDAVTPFVFTHHKWW